MTSGMGTWDRSPNDPASGGRTLARGCGWLGLGGVLSAGAIVIALGLLVSSIGPCDLNIGRHPGKGKRSRHLAITVQPASGLRDRQQVRVTSSAFGHLVGVAVCLQEADTKRRGVDACDTVHGSRYFAKENGGLDVTYRVPRVISVGGRAYDCATRPRRCLVVAADADDYNESGGQPVTFRSGLPPAVLVAQAQRDVTNRLPVIVQPEGSLRAGQQLTVDVAGFQPGEPLLITWCTRSVYETRSLLDLVGICDVTPASFDLVALGKRSSAAYHADGSGHVHVVRHVPMTTDASKGCSSNSDVCVFVVAAGADTQRSALTRIRIRR